MMRRQHSFGWSFVAIATLFVAVAAAEVSAQTVSINRCAGAKTRCVMGKTHVCGVAGVRGVFKCYQNAESRSSPVDPECLLLAVNELRECFLYAERRLGPCLTSGDAATVQAKINTYVLDIVTDLDPTHPRPNKNLCAANKMKAVAETTADKLGCFDEAFKTDGTVSATCLAEPSGHFAYLWDRIEVNGGCLTINDNVAVEAKIDAFVADMVITLDP